MPSARVADVTLGPLIRIGRPPRGRHARGRGRPPAPGFSHAWPIRRISPPGWRPVPRRSAFGLDGPFLGQFAGQRSDRLSPASTAPPAPSPHAGPGRDPFRAPSGQPAALAVTRHAQHRQRAVGVPVRRDASASPPARGPARRTLRRSGRAAHRRRRGRKPRAAQRGDRAVGLGRLLERRLEGVSLQRNDTRSSGQDRARGFRAGTRQLGIEPTQQRVAFRFRVSKASGKTCERLRRQRGSRQELPLGGKADEVASPSSTSSAWAGTRAT